MLVVDNLVYHLWDFLFLLTDRSLRDRPIALRPAVYGSILN